MLHEILFMQDVDYEATMAVKLSIARKIFNLEKEKVLSSSSFQKFFSENQVRPFFQFHLTQLYQVEKNCHSINQMKVLKYRKV